MPQRLLAGILPFAAMVLLFPSKFKARAWEVPLRQPQPSIVAKNKQQWSSRLQLPKPVASMLEELLVCVRGLYLAMLFSPALALAPLVFWLGLGAQQGREMWMDLLLWTIERAGMQQSAGQDFTCCRVSTGTEQRLQWVMALSAGAVSDAGII